jgi:hypothetical protein
LKLRFNNSLTGSSRLLKKGQSWRPASLSAGYIATEWQLGLLSASFFIDGGALDGF